MTVTVTQVNGRVTLNGASSVTARVVIVVTCDVTRFSLIPVDEQGGQLCITSQLLKPRMVSNLEPAPLLLNIPPLSTDTPHSPVRLHHDPRVEISHLPLLTSEGVRARRNNPVKLSSDLRCL